MASVAVIAEFNPFHNGHLHLLREIRRELGQDTRVAAIMSGSFVQRGDLAIADPYVRAESALRAGYDLVLELPFPYTISSAEYFAGAGVSLADSLGCFDILAFGCECGNIATLKQAADVIESPAFSSRVNALRTEGDGKKKSYGVIAREALRALLPEKDQALLDAPNNILAVEYLRALRRLNSKIEPLAVKRAGDGYHDAEPSHNFLTSASAIRGLLREENTDKLATYIEAEALLPLIFAIERGHAPIFLDRLSVAILAHFISLSRTDKTVTDGLLSRILYAAPQSHDLGDLLNRISTGSHTGSSLRRFLLQAYFGVTSSELGKAPSYTRVLGFRDSGRMLLKDAKRKASVALLTKTADYRALPPNAREDAFRSLSADSIARLALPSGGIPADAFRGAPCHIASTRGD